MNTCCRLLHRQYFKRPFKLSGNFCCPPYMYDRCHSTYAVRTAAQNHIFKATVAGESIRIMQRRCTVVNIRYYLFRILEKNIRTFIETLGEWIKETSKYSTSCRIFQIFSSMRQQVITKGLLTKDLLNRLTLSIY